MSNTCQAKCQGPILELQCILFLLLLTLVQIWESRNVATYLWTCFFSTCTSPPSAPLFLQLIFEGMPQVATVMEKRCCSSLKVCFHLKKKNENQPPPKRGFNPTGTPTTLQQKLWIAVLYSLAKIRSLVQANCSDGLFCGFWTSWV